MNLGEFNGFELNRDSLFEEVPELHEIIELSSHIRGSVSLSSTVELE